MLKNAIQILAENYDTPLENLDEYKQIVEENKQDPNLFNIINEQFRPMNIKIGTAGSYLWGCDQNYYGNINKTCSALCNGGIGYENNNQTCQYQIWTYINKLLLKDNISSSKAYIYVSKEWNGFKKEDVEKLKNNGVEFATILITENSKHEIIVPIVQVEDLPIVEEIEIKEVDPQSYKIYYIILFFIIILFMFFIFYNSNF